MYSSGQGERTKALGAAKHRCDFCERGQSGGVVLVTGGSKRNIEDNLELAFRKALNPIRSIESESDGHWLTKALVPLSDIDRETKEEWVSKARYGEEDYAAARKIFVLELSVVLEKNVTLEIEQLKKYKLWTNARTYHNVYLLPNSTRVYDSTLSGLIKTDYIAETFRGDLLGTGNEYDIDVISALTEYAFINAVIPVGSTGSLDFRTGTLTLPEQAHFELYLDEVSGSWIRRKIKEGFIQVMIADQDEANKCALNGADLPNGKITMGLTPDGETITGFEEEKNLQHWKKYWFGDTPETAEDDDQTLIFLLINEETDEVDAFRTSRSMLAAGVSPIDVSAYLHRDSKADRMEEEKYNILFFDTPKGERSLVKVVTNVLTGYELETPLPLRIVLRRNRVKGTNVKLFSVTGHQFVILDVSKGGASLPEIGYYNHFDGNVFETEYIRIEDILTGNMKVTFKKGQPIWAEWKSENTAEDLNGFRYILVNEKWYREDEAPVQSNSREPEAA